MACHNLLHHNALPPGTRDLLGLGLNYCIAPSKIETTTETFTRLSEDVRQKFHLNEKPPDDTQDSESSEREYIPSLYIKSDYKFDNATEEIEDALSSFEAAVRAAQFHNSCRQKFKPNLSITQWNLLRYLRRHDKYIVIEADKNLGPCILDRKIYFERGCLEHLGNRRNYKQLTKQRADTLLRGLHYKFDAWLNKFYWDWYYTIRRGQPYNGPTPISGAECTFLLRAKRRDEGRHARFRMTGKVHKPKKPQVLVHPMRPIVCCAGTFMNDWSRWLDYQLQRLKPFVPSYLKDSQQVLDELQRLNLPPNARIYTADANSMYNNIDTDHACEVIGAWLDELAPQITGIERFPVEAIKDAMSLIMRNNIFEWGSLYFLQLIGTAMGTSAAVMWATLYFGYHEAKTLLPKYGTYHLYYRRFIDDIVGIWLWDNSTAWNDHIADVNNFKILTWEFEPLGDSANFLDLTLTINNGKIDTRTYQKEMNLYLYLLPSSAHSPSVLKGTIYGLLS